MPKFTAQNRTPGNLVIADSLNEAVAAIAEASDIVAFACVTKQIGGWGVVPLLWLVYEDQTKLDMDRDANGTAEHVHWFAVISSTEVSGCPKAPPGVGHVSAPLDDMCIRCAKKGIRS